MMNKNIFINDFFKDHDMGIKTIFNTKAKFKYETLDQFTESLNQEITHEYDKLLMKGLLPSEINAQLFYFVNDFCKSIFPPKKKEKQYLCPGCLYFGEQSVLDGDTYLKCKVCNDKVKKTKDVKEIVFYKTFANHNQSGYKCNDCSRFIPKINSSSEITCPYFDCLFVGKSDAVKKMHHPHLKEDTISVNGKSLPKCETININNAKSLHIKEVIDYQLNNLVYSSFNFTLKHKVFVYQAFLNLLDEFPTEMSDYLLHQSRSGGFQHKVFQKYISLLEESFPFVIKKNNKIIRIDNLLDDNLSLFEGISTFEAIVNKNVIKNNTQEYYIGGRSASYTKPYYIGKLLNVIHKDTKISLMDNVDEYSFSKIKLHDIESNTPVIVTHLRVPPHYQMGGMVYVNRIRKKIVDALTK